MAAAGLFARARVEAGISWQGASSPESARTIGTVVAVASRASATAEVSSQCFLSRARGRVDCVSVSVSVSGTGCSSVPVLFSCVPPSCIRGG
ncbi:hypothetical protein B1R27_22550 [Streptomyces sp. GKU 895]|nr:hypothetical protein B1R27_22550 [Streptomyces sp. GKU 895]